MFSQTQEVDSKAAHYYAEVHVCQLAQRIHVYACMHMTAHAQFLRSIFVLYKYMRSHVFHHLSLCVHVEPCSCETTAP